MSAGIGSSKTFLSNGCIKDAARVKIEKGKRIRVRVGSLTQESIQTED